ncbi:MAG: hypothetical protein AAFW97_00985 [Pseudomonadota bacterium]
MAAGVLGAVSATETAKACSTVRPSGVAVNQFQQAMLTGELEELRAVLTEDFIYSADNIQGGLAREEFIEYAEAHLIVEGLIVRHQLLESLGVRAAVWVTELSPSPFRPQYERPNLGCGRTAETSYFAIYDVQQSVFDRTTGSISVFESEKIKSLHRHYVRGGSR